MSDEGRTRQTPTEVSTKSESSFGSVRLTIFDVVSFVENDSMPSESIGVSTPYFSDREEIKKRTI